MAGEVIVCGYGRVGRSIVECLLRCGLPVTVIDADARAGAKPPAGRVRFVTGDCREPDALIEAGVASARAVICATSEDLVNVASALAVRRLAADVRLVVRVFQESLVHRLATALRGAVALSTSRLTAPIFAQSAVVGETLGSFELDGKTLRIAELTVDADSPMAGAAIGTLRSRFGVTPLALVPANGSPSVLTVMPTDKVPEAGDRITVVGEVASVAALQGGSADGGGMRFAGRLRRFVRVARTALGQDPAVPITAALLVLVVLMGWATFVWGRDRTALDGFYLTIAVMAGEESDEPFAAMPDWEKLFITLLRIAGVGVLGGFFAILTNFLVTAKLGRAMQLRKVPEAGHMVICGLGNVGLRVLETLVRSRVRTVVIERDPSNRYLATATRLGVPVIVGDATDLESLRAAGAAGARAVLALSSNDLVNFEVALAARELNAHVRTILRLVDPQMAKVLQEAAGMRTAFSVAALAAPAFVSQALGESVPCVFLSADEVFLVAELTVGADEPQLLGKSPAQLGEAYGVVVVGRQSVGGKFVEPGEARPLVAGERFTAIMRPGDLARMQTPFGKYEV